MKLPFAALIALSLTPLAASAYDEVRQEQEIIACSQMGFVPGEAAFTECRMRVRGEWEQAEYEASRAAELQAYQMQPVYEDYSPAYYEPRHPKKYCPRRERYFNPNDYYDEYGRRCKKTHRGWILCK